MLCSLRALPMTRSAFIVLLFGALLCLPAHAQSSVNAGPAVQPEHSTSSRAKSAHHRAVHHSTHPSTARAASHRRTRHAAVRHTAVRRTAHSHHVVHHYTAAHQRRLARLHRERRLRVAREQEAESHSRGSSAASALAMSLSSPALSSALARTAPRDLTASTPHLSDPAEAHPLSDSHSGAPELAIADIPPTSAVSIDSAAQSASFHPDRIIPTAPLRGSFESLARQNERTQADGLERIVDNTDLNDRIAKGFLVPVPLSAGLTVNDRLPENHRYCRPWTADFLADLARAHQAQFHHPLEISSAVRTIDYQKHLERINGNAASAVGEVVSPHVTGATIDITKKGMSSRELNWMRMVLGDLQNQGVLDVEEEFHQACFHITVYKSFISRNALRQTRSRELKTAAVTDSPS